jgi:hypothetical protein
MRSALSGLERLRSALSELEWMIASSYHVPYRGEAVNLVLKLTSGSGRID